MEGESFVRIIQGPWRSPRDKEVEVVHRVEVAIDLDLDGGPGTWRLHNPSDYRCALPRPRTLTTIKKPTSDEDSEGDVNVV